MMYHNRHRCYKDRGTRSEQVKLKQQTKVIHNNYDTCNESPSYTYSSYDSTYDYGRIGTFKKTCLFHSIITDNPLDVIREKPPARKSRKGRRLDLSKGQYMPILQFYRWLTVLHVVSRDVMSNDKSLGLR